MSMKFLLFVGLCGCFIILVPAASETETGTVMLPVHLRYMSNYMSVHYHYQPSLEPIYMEIQEEIAQIPADSPAINEWRLVWRHEVPNDPGHMVNLPISEKNMMISIYEEDRLKIRTILTPEKAETLKAITYRLSGPLVLEFTNNTRENIYPDR